MCNTSVGGQGEQCLGLEGERKVGGGGGGGGEGEINVSNQPPNFFLLHLWSAYLCVSSKDCKIEP